MDKSDKEDEFNADWRNNRDVLELLDLIALILAAEYVEFQINEQKKDD